MKLLTLNQQKRIFLLIDVEISPVFFVIFHWKKPQNWKSPEKPEKNPHFNFSRNSRNFAGNSRIIKSKCCSRPTNVHLWFFDVTWSRLKITILIRANLRPYKLLSFLPKNFKFKYLRPQWSDFYDSKSDFNPKNSKLIIFDLFDFFWTF